jgi:hypothetical protein
VGAAGVGVPQASVGAAGAEVPQASTVEEEEEDDEVEVDVEGLGEPQALAAADERGPG